MHILIIAPEQIPVPPVKGGSVEICIEQIAKRLAQQHKVTVVSRRHKRYPDYQVLGNLTYIRVPSPGPASPLTYIRTVLRKMAGKSFDWIQIDNRPRFIPAVKAAFPHTPISLYLHSLTFVSPNRITAREARHCLSKANLIVTNSESTRAHLKRMFPIIESKLRKVWLGVDDALFRPFTPEMQSGARSEFRISQRPTVLFVGRLIPRKGLPVLLEAAHIARKQHPTLQVVIAGSGTRAYEQRMRQLARKLRVPTRWLGNIPHRRIYKVYRVADCFVCPSQQHESFGLVNIEAMSSGLPVVASRIGGIKDIIDHKYNGLLVKPYRDSRKFAKYISRIMDNRQWREQLQGRARSTVQARFSWEATVRQLLRLYHEERT